MEKSPEIPSEEPRNETPSELPAVVVLGCGFKKDAPTTSPNPIDLDKWSKMRTIAAGMMFEKGLAGQIILSGGKLFSADRPSVAEVMKRYLLLKFPQIPEGSIMLEEESTDTSENAENVVRLLRERDLPGAIVLTNKPHLPRAEKLFRSAGVKVYAGTAAETKIRERSEKHAHLVRRQALSMDKLKFWGREFVLRGLLYLDPEGKAIRGIAHKRKPKNDNSSL